MNLAGVINFCTNDIRFFDRCIEEASKVCNYLIVPICDHFFDGTPERRDLLEDLYARYPQCTFIEYAYSPDKLYSRFIDLSPQDLDWKMYWYATSRYIGFLYAPFKVEYFLFLDVDEILDGKRFSAWLEASDIEEYEALRFSAYYYFREASFQAKEWGDNALLAKKRALSHHVLFQDWDRKGAFSRIQGRKTGQVVGLDGKPLIHHYSWVKTKEESLKKAVTSGHFWEKDFTALVEKEFESSFQGKDFTFSHEYITVEPFFDPLSCAPRYLPKTTSRALKVNREDVFRKEIEQEFLFT